MMFLIKQLQIYKNRKRNGHSFSVVFPQRTMTDIFLYFCHSLTYVDITWKTGSKAQSQKTGAEQCEASLHISFCISEEQENRIPSMGMR